ncbi:oxygenase MpaB family protein [Mycobacteroides salmoniphilum]|uniref:oxygenase MpaB family protein n=1 Tax=Mycobacteroides salmoniphilum TaxID=404941 RepID=UPI001064FDBD|nr:oxygenase MpaB family protein [Mycobacteroides salmoniphilum]TDZ92522.1 Latex clearing protein precursor [Mycobacteroides salmoniphilum]
MPKLTAADRSSARDPHPYDYYHRPGMDLRPIPGGKNDFGWIWRHCRHTLFDNWFDVEDEVTPTPLTRLFDDHMWQGDELMDAVVAVFDRIGSQQARPLFERAITEGIDSLDDPPDELRALLEDAYRVPEWWDPAKAERGRVRLNQMAAPTVLLMASFGVFDTVMNSDVSATTGASGRFRDQGQQRLLETARFFAALRDRDAMRPGSPQIQMTLRVRLVHSLARKGLRAAWGTENFSDFGVPISNSSMCGFIEAESLGQMLIEHRFGRPCTREELDDAWHYMTRWALLFGISEELCPKSGTDAMHNLDYLLARSGDASRWRVELVEVLSALPSAVIAPLPVPRLRKLLSDLMFVAGIGAPGWVLMGPEAMDEFVRGTSYERLPRQLPGRALQAAMSVSARAAAIRDRVPGTQVARRIVYGTLLPNPSAVLNPAFGILEKLNKVSSTYTMHDTNTSGDAFAR